jgi:hypothetical protein
VNGNSLKGISSELPEDGHGFCEAPVSSTTRSGVETPMGRTSEEVRPIEIAGSCDPLAVAPTGVDPVTFRFSVERSTN